MGWDSKVDEVHAGSSCPRQPSCATRHHRPHSNSNSTSPPRSRSQWSGSPSDSPSPVVSVSCVTRETSQDDCSYSRFVAWVAVKRNTYRFISSSEKLQCPLIRCRKEFPDHEHMLRHLAACEHLPSREYWCYDHMCIERFDDVRCRKCISHPSRRRRMLSMAKTFFSTLGHKSRRGPDFDLDVDDDGLLAPPSYNESQHESHQALNLDPPEKPELPSSTEILEIDSHEVTVPVPVVNPQDLLLPELDSVPMQSSMQWQPTPFVSPMGSDFSAAAPAYESLSASRPTSVGPPPAPQLVQPVPKPVPTPTRSKNLSPSSSVRSTTSTMSNISSISTSSSLWSAPSTAWSGMETNFTSLSMDLISPVDISRSDDFESLINKRPLDPLDTISELPADAELHELSTGDFDPRDSFFAFDPNTTSIDASYPVDFTLEEKEPVPATAQQLQSDSPTIFQSEAKSLVAAAWDALQEHILSSQAKINHIRNPLAGQLGMLSSQTIAHKGLTSLRRILEGRPLTSPLDTLSLVHVIYSFSLVVYGDDAIRRSSELFAQSLLYSAWFIPENQAQFREVATAIWRPSDMTDDHLSQLMKRQSSSLPRTFSHNGKGKGRAMTEGIKEDPLVSAAQTFLDGTSMALLETLKRTKPRENENIVNTSIPELEATAVLGSSFEAHATEIRARHFLHENPGFSAEDSGAVNVGGLMSVLNVLVNRFHDVDGLIAQLNEVNQSVKNGDMRSTRRFELEALQAGQNCIGPSKYFDSYVPLVRSLCDPIYELDGNPGVLKRHDHYALGISLSEALITELEAEPMDFDAVSTDESDHDAFLDSLTPPLTEELMDLDVDIQPLLGLGFEPLDVRPASTIDTTGNSTPMIGEAAPAAASTSLSRSPSSASSSNATQTQTPSSSSSASPPQQPTQQPKIEADACCEICGYRPKGDPRWFHGSMAKHKKLQHSTDPPVIYRCRYPGCKSAYKNRPDNLRQHQIEKDHFVEGDEGASRRPSKRKKISS